MFIIIVLNEICMKLKKMELKKNEPENDESEYAMINSENKSLLVLSVL